MKKPSVEHSKIDCRTMGIVVRENDRNKQLSGVDHSNEDKGAEFGK